MSPTYTVEATQNGQSTSGTVNVVSSTTSYSLTLSFVSATLNSNSWATIRSVSDNGQGANYWSVGDRKAVTLNGTVGSLTLSNFATYAFILGFNHNAGYEGSNRIHFQLAKTAVSGGTDVALCDSSCPFCVASTVYVPVSVTVNETVPVLVFVATVGSRRPGRGRSRQRSTGRPPTRKRLASSIATPSLWRSTRRRPVAFVLPIMPYTAFSHLITGSVIAPPGFSAA